MSTGSAASARSGEPLVDTKKVTGRRTLRLRDYDELLAELSFLRSKDLKTIGNWSAGQIFDHLAKATDMMIDGNDFRMPGPMRWLMTRLMKKKFLTKGLPAGFKIPKGARGVAPDEVDAQEGLRRLTAATERAKSEQKRAMHPVFGNLSREEADQFHLRHAELHLSFIKPE